MGLNVFVLSVLCGKSLSAQTFGPADEACNLGGYLEDGVCNCYPTFTGSHCAQLNLQAAETSEAFSRDGAASWGGTVRQGDDGRYHMYLADMLNHCGLSSWECNSAITHAVAPKGSPEGPYEEVETIMRPFAHNPTMQVHQGKWIIYHIGTGEQYKPEMFCEGGVTNGTCGAEILEDWRDMEDEDPGLPNILHADGPDGPWEVQAGTNTWALNNPTAFIYENGTTLIIYKVGCNATVNPDNKFCRQFAVATSDSWKGPFKFHSRMELFGEDAHIWRCPFSGTFHFLFQGGSYTPALPQWPGHFHKAHSRNGLDGWTITGGSSTGSEYVRHPGFYMAHPSPAGDSTARSVQASQTRCEELGDECSGFTCDAAEHACTLRTGKSLSASASGEVSYQKTAGQLDTLAFTNTVPLRNGSVVTYRRRERHQLLLDSNGAPSHLFNGVGTSHQDFTLTSVQPIATAPVTLTMV